MPSFLFASDSFKGSISSKRTAELLCAAGREVWPDAELRSVAVADGGEGTVEALIEALGGEAVVVTVEGPGGSGVKAMYGLLPGHRAVIEMAAASGLTLLSPEERNPLVTSTFGTGQLILDALDRGVVDISLAIGGSATNDGGMGCLRALGVRFLDGRGNELAGRGEDLAKVNSIDLEGVDRRIEATDFHVMCDVDNPLLGTRGAAAMFAPQKGANTSMVAELEEGMKSYAGVLARTFGTDVSCEPGMGASGGLGIAARLFLRAEVVPGIEHVLDLVGFDGLLAGADLCVTGEGHADSQSVHGKLVSGVARRCKRRGVPCVALVGAMDASATELLGYGVSAIVPTVIGCTSVADAMDHAEQNFTLAADRMFSLLRIGSGLVH